MGRRFLLIGLLLLLTADALTAQRLHFERITVDHGLSGNWVRAIVQDQQGFLWIGTQEGLNRYDGYSFEAFRYRHGDPGSLSGNAVMSLLEDRDGRIWIGTNNGLNRFDQARQTFIQYGSGSGLGRTLIRALYQDRSGAMWVGSRGGLHRWNPDSDDFTVYGRLQNADDRSTAVSVTAIHEDRSGNLWIGTEEAGLALFDRRTGSITPVRSADQAQADGVGNHVSFVHEDQNGRLWVATLGYEINNVGAGLHQFEPSRGTFRSFHYSGGEFVDAPFNASAMLENEDGTFWVSTFGATPRAALVLFDPEDGGFTSHTYDPQNPASLSWDYVSVLHRDRSGIIWVGTSRGLNKLDIGRAKFAHHKEILDNPYDLRDNIYAIYEDPEGVLWFGIDGPGGLVEYDPVAGSFTRHNLAEASGTERNPVWALTDDLDGSLWLGSDSGLHRFDRRTRRFRTYRNLEIAGGPSDGIVSALHRDRAGRLWIGTQTGLSRLDPKRNAITTYRHDPADPHSLSGNAIRVIYEDQSGAVWIGTNPHVNDASGVGADGLNRLDPETGAIRAFRHDPLDPRSLSDNGINTIYQDRTGTLWIGTDNGLNRFDEQSGTFRYYLQEDGLPSAVVAGILEDESGHLWVSTHGGLSQFDPIAETFRNYGPEDGLQNRRFNFGSAHKSPSGELFFGGVSGLNSFHPQQITNNPQVPPVALTSFMLRDGVGTLPGALSALEEIVLPFRENAFSFEFAALSFRMPEKNQYAYMLEGFDRDWVQAGTRRYASYTNLAPGAYTFRVKASNNDGVWNEEGASVRLRVLAPWWRTWWAYAVYGFLALAGVFGMDRYQRRRLILRERERAREREVEQKREIERAYQELERAHVSLKATQAQLVQQEKLASLGALTAGIAHEIKNPLNFVNNFAELNVELAEELRKELTEHPAALSAVADLLDDVEMNAAKIEEHGKRADGIVRSMLEHSRGESGERRAVDLNALVEEHVNLAYHGKRAQQPAFTVTVERDYGEAVGAVEIVPQEVGRVVLNLVGNAFDAVTERAVRHDGQGDGHFTPTVRVETRRMGEYVEVRVADNGPGIPDDVRGRIFEPFFTTKPTGEGTGLGLSMSYDIVTQRHGGSLNVESAPGEGTVFVITLPARQTAQDHQRVPAV